MESLSHKITADADRQADIRRQIEVLQAQLQEFPEPSSSSSVSQSIPTKQILAPKTPSPKKKPPPPAAPIASTSASATQRAVSRNAPQSNPTVAQQPSATSSGFLSSLSNLKRNADHEDTEPIQRSTGFSEAPASARNLDEQRDDSLAIIEKLEIGPLEHKPPPDDPTFARYEPNSGIYLSSRSLPHDTLQDHLRGRYYLSPSMLYSVIRLTSNNQAYDVPVEGDWVTIAVIAERGPVKVTTMPSSTVESESRFKGDSGDRKSSGKKYLSLKLVDFGSRSSSSSNVKKEIRGDALLNLLLFESDTYSREVKDGQERFATKIYKGGSGGAFEMCASLREGTVLAILNPRVLKPFQRGGVGGDRKPHPRDNVLAITPSSASSLLVVGQSRDLGLCRAMRKDGKACGSWFDKTVNGESGVCEWHVVQAVKSKRASRAEFSVGTTGMSTTPGSRYAKKPKFDAESKTGLLPSSKQRGSGDATYVFAGAAISTAGNLDEFVGEKIGRGRQERLKRKREQEEGERAFTSAIENKSATRDTNMLLAARDALVKDKQKEKEKDKGKGNAKSKPRDTSSSLLDPLRKENKASQHAYSVDLIKAIGFNPTRAGADKLKSNENIQEKLAALQSKSSTEAPELGPRPGKKHRTSVVNPTAHKAAPDRVKANKSDPEEDSDDTDLSFGVAKWLMGAKAVVPGSDSDLEIEPSS